MSYGAEILMVPKGSKRLLAFVALRRGSVDRAHAAGTLWPFGDDTRAAGNLRSALWRLRRAGVDVLEADKWSLTLRPEVQVDVHLLEAWAGRLIRGIPEPDDLTLVGLPADAFDLLPGWYDDWAIIDRERMRQRMLHALDALSRTFTELGRYADAIDAALTAVAAEPLRESAQRTLLQALLKRGDWAEAERTFERFRRLLRAELNVEPSGQLRALLTSPEAAAISQ